MKSFLLLFFLIFSGSASALSGSWKYTELIYQGQRRPIMNPDLNLVWTFFDNGTERLFWNYNGLPGFCERFGTFRVQEGYLEEETFAVNPNNNYECGRDPDMQVGRKTKSPIKISDQEILLYFNLGDEEVAYVLTPFISEKKP